MSASPARAAAISALQAALAAENAAVFGYGVAGARLTGARRAAARRDWTAHQAAHDDLASMLISRGGQPPPAATSYQLPFPVHNPAAAVSLAVYLEDRLATAYLALVALSDTDLRVFGARALRDAAMRASAWRGDTLAFPGFETPAPPGHVSAAWSPALRVPPIPSAAPARTRTKPASPSASSSPAHSPAPTQPPAPAPSPTPSPSPSLTAP